MKTLKMGPGRGLVPIPQEIAPDKLTCVQLMIPDSVAAKRQLMGMVRALSRWNQYDRDSAHSAKAWADIWKIACQYTIESCGKEPQLIEEWEDKLAICESLRWHNGVLQGFCCGEWVDIPTDGTGYMPGATQPTGTDRPAPGATGCQPLLLNAKGVRVFPFPVLNGDIVTVTQITGDWWDGAIGPWYAPDGSSAPFLIPSGIKGHAGGDPSGTAYHMQLIAEAGGVYYPVNSGVPFTIAGPSGSQQLQFQANDGTLDDNQGDISFLVCVQNGQSAPVSEWCFTLDFRYSDYGWTPYTSGLGARAAYVTGQGWQVGPSYNGLIQVLSPVVASTQFTSAEVILSTPLSGPDHTIDIEVNGPGGTPHLVVDNTHTDIVVPISPAVTGTQLFFNIESDTAVPGALYAGYLQAVVMRGTGVNPFGSNNC